MADIGVRLTGDNSEYRAMLNESVAETDKFGEQVAEKIAHHVIGVRALGQALSTALGLHLTEIAEKLARAFTNMSEETAEKLKEFDRISKESADSNIEFARKRNTEEKNYQLALVQRDALQKRSNEQDEKAAEINEQIKEIHEGDLSNFAAAFQLRKLAAEQEELRNEHAQTSHSLQAKQQEVILYNDKQRLETAQKLDEVMKHQFELMVEEIDADETAKEKHAKAIEKINKLVGEQLPLRQQIQRSYEDEYALIQQIAGEKKRGENTDESQIKLLETQKQIIDLNLNLQKESAAVEKDKLAALKGETSEFGKQLEAIRVMAGAGKSGFKASASGGGEATTTVPLLRTALLNAQNAAAYAEKHINDLGGGKNYGDALNLVQKLTDALHMGEVSGAQLGNNFGAIPISSLGLDSISENSDTARAIKSTASDAATTAARMKSIDQSLQTWLDELGLDSGANGDNSTSD